ncbi:hypothetical protein AB1Y20_020192 [Prymnesium parvum]|uniref:Sec-independent protein translocase protein TatA n=1 Tax=Prymnesium parvum TaxID=97485 RepID=A0AB34JWW6_PRYPA
MAVEITRALLFVAAMCARSEAFTLTPRIISPTVHPHMAPSSLQATFPLQARLATTAARHNGVPQMGLFGLGWAEIGVLAAVGLLVFGPEKLAPLAKDIGKSASGLKEVADSFSEGLSEGNVDVQKLKNAAPSVVTDTSAKEEEEKKQ